MDMPYFATYTGCDDLFLVCQRNPEGRNPRVVLASTTMDEAQLDANHRNVDQLVHKLQLLNESDSAGYSSGDHLLVMMKTTTQLADLLTWDMGGYRIERDRTAAAEAITAPGDTENEHVA